MTRRYVTASEFMGHPFSYVGCSGLYNAAPDDANPIGIPCLITYISILQDSAVEVRVMPKDGIGEFAFTDLTKFNPSYIWEEVESDKKALSSTTLASVATWITFTVIGICAVYGGFSICVLLAKYFGIN